MFAHHDNDSETYRKTSIRQTKGKHFDRYKSKIGRRLGDKSVMASGRDERLPVN